MHVLDAVEHPSFNDLVPPSEKDPKCDIFPEKSENIDEEYPVISMKMVFVYK